MIKLDINSKDLVEDFLKNLNLESYYSVFPTFYSHFCKGIYQSFFYDNIIIIKKYNTNPRIFIIGNIEDINIEYIKKKFNPLFINQILINEKLKIFEPEYIFNNKEIINNLNTSKFKTIRNSCNYIKNHYNNIKVEKLSVSHKKQLINFIYEWKNQHKNYFRLTYRRDIFLLDLIDELFGTVILDNNKIIGAEINCEILSNKNMCVNIFRKSNVKYKNLHDFLKVSGCITCLNYNYEYSNDCNATSMSLKKYKDKFLGEKGYMYPISQDRLYEKKIQDSKQIFF